MSQINTSKLTFFCGAISLPEILLVFFYFDEKLEIPQICVIFVENVVAGGRKTSQCIE